MDAPSSCPFCDQRETLVRACLKSARLQRPLGLPAEALAALLLHRFTYALPIHSPIKSWDPHGQPPPALSQISDLSDQEGGSGWETPQGPCSRFPVPRLFTSPGRVSLVHSPLAPWTHSRHCPTSPSVHSFLTYNLHSHPCFAFCPMSSTDMYPIAPSISKGH